MPRQERSRRTERAIADALRSLLKTSAFPDITVAEIARTSGVSVGGIYARFGSKGAILRMVELNMLDEWAAIAQESLAGGGTDLPSIIRRYCSLLVGNFRRYRAEILQILRYVGNNPEAKTRLMRFNHGVHARMRELLSPYASGHAVSIALFGAGAMAREAVLQGNLKAYPVEMTDEELAVEIAGIFSLYLSPRASPQSETLSRPDVPE
jgi:AcrR family transcriptional regulator